MALKDVVARLKRTAPGRAWQRYSDADGSLLAAGIGYFAFFSVFPAMALAFTVFGFVLRGRPDLLDTIANSLNEALPGMIKTAEHPTGIIGLSAPESGTLTLAGVTSLATLLLSGLGWIDAMRRGIRAVLGAEHRPDNVFRAKARDLGVMAVLGLAIAVSAVLTSAIGGLAEEVTGWVGLDGNTVPVTIIGLAVGVAFDTVIMVILLRLLSGVQLPWSNLRSGALLGAILLTTMKYFGGILIERATSNPLLGAVAVAVGLLFWLNLMSRIVLLAAAWAANALGAGRIANDSGTP